MAPSQSTTSDTSWNDQIAALQEHSRQAYLSKDIATLNRLWSDDFIVNSPINRVLPKAEVLKLLEQGIIAHSAYDEHIETTVRQGDTVIVMGRDQVINAPSTPKILRRFTNVWRAQGDTWQLVARHANPLPQA